MLASWYDEQGPAIDVLRVGELPDPTPGPGEVRVRVTVSGVNPGDTKKRRGWTGSAMPHPRVIPHSDAAGVIDAVGAGVDARRSGQRVWVYGAQSYRPFGTAAQYTVVPADLAVPLPGHLDDDLGASLGIPGITAHRTVFADGPVDGQLVLVNGVLGGVGSLAAQLARWAGAVVIGTVRSGADLDRVDPAVVSHAVALDSAAPAAEIRAHAPNGVDRIIEVSLSDNAELDNAVVANGAVIAAYATRADPTEIPFWPLLFNNVTLRLLGSDDFPAEVKREAARELTAAAAVGALTVEVGDRFPLADLAKAHDRVDAGGLGRVLVDIPQ
ncbi:MULTISPECIES: NADPH:quinone reductase [unclassified Streptomyces]|uniref:NADPH:quinone reductase n=1 Tax=unclassified Streptomyces TaxID=2593676 RepID=UPI001BE5D32B|nr:MULTISPECIES: NADPH:quinone reductase [unclassified Streptomyces]MBT2408758.1 NADPH:quinone reductase [Streptomyces sp. ISL-21]MBT2613830.1 NADPH:quinone reductase [Streptomyces sp. ISL-87]